MISDERLYEGLFKLLDSNRERVAFIIFFVLLFLRKIADMEEADFKTLILNAFFIYYITKNLHFTINTFSKHLLVKKLNLLADLKKKNLTDAIHLKLE